MKKLILLLFLCGLFSRAVLWADESADSGPGVSEAPYFWVPSSEEGVDELPLKSTEVDVRIEGILATVTVKQVYRNEGELPIEASYVFPGSTRAAVNDLSFRIGERVIVAEIKEKEEARATYETAKKEGKRTVLLEQHRPNVFQMNVANILPADVVTVELVYTETLPRIEGNYEFVYPTVVGPRYSEDTVSGLGGSTDWVSSPFLTPDAEVKTPDFRLRVDLVQGQALSRVGSPSHSIDVHYPAENRATAELGKEALRSDNRDFILRYSLAEDEPTAGVLIQSEEDGGYFFVNIEPPLRKPSGLAVPREYLFLLDVSGSMNGFPLEISKKIMGELIGDLGAGDSFNMIAFAGGSEIFSARGSVPADPGSRIQAIHWIDNLQGSGGTSLLPALKRILAQSRVEGVSRTVVVLTDGYVTVEREAFELVRNSLGEANLFTIGIGSSVNRHLIEGMARAGGGDSFVATNPAEGAELCRQFVQRVKNPVLTDIKLNFEGLEVSELLPPQQPDLFLMKPVRVIGKFSGKWKGSLSIQGRNGPEVFERVIDFQTTPAGQADSLRILWAREKVRFLMDQLIFENEDQIRPMVVELGLTYRLLTRYTSFVAVEKEVARTEAELKSVKQPSPLPAGVSALAVGGGVPASPEPGTVGLFLIVCGILCFVLRGKLRGGSE